MSNQLQIELPSSVIELQEMVIELHTRLDKLEGVEQALADVEAELIGVEEKLGNVELENEILRERVRLLTQKQFGHRSERFPYEMENIQRLLFEDLVVRKARNEEEDDSGVEQIVIAEHRRKKKKSGRKPLPADLPRVEVEYDISEKEKQCGCGSRMIKISEEVSEHLNIEPAHLWVEKVKRPKYACKACEGLESQGCAVKIAPAPEAMIEKSMSSPSLLAHIFISKFCDALPFYRQEKQLKRYGIKIPRSTMCNWALEVASRLRPLTEMLRLEVLSGTQINVDETWVQVLFEPDRSAQDKSYIWVFSGGKEGKPAVYYRYAPSRGGEVAREFLGDYRGYVQTDGYSGYNFIDGTKGMIHVGCWSHARRNFYEVLQAGGKKFKISGKADEALKIIQDLYMIEREAEDMGLSEEDIYRLRQKRSKPILERFHEWLKETVPGTPPKSLLGKAINYALAQWPRLVRYLEDGKLKMDNNSVENKIRPFVMGRKNWLFSFTPAGARASAAFYSLIETAKANGLEPYRYFLYLFDRYPHARTTWDIFNLLPMNVMKSEIDSHYLEKSFKNLSQPRS
jgi:transposase